MEKTWCVYKHTNRENGKVYIGITSNLKRRWGGNGSAYKSNRHFWQAIEKYGWDGFDHAVLASGLSHAEACAEEIRLIAEHEALNREKGYNNSPGGDNPLVVKSGVDHPMYGKHPSPETLAKYSAAKRGENHPWYGKHLSEETRRKIGDANRGRKLSEEQKAYLSKINTGKKLSEESIRKRSLKMMGHAVSDETRQKIRETKTLKPVVQLSLTGEIIRVWPSTADAIRGTGLTGSQIRKCCKGVLKTSGGFIWRYEETT